MSYVSSTSTSYANVFKHDPDVIGRDLTGSNTSYAKWKIYGSTTSGSTLTVRATTPLGQTTCELATTGLTDIDWSEITVNQPIYTESLLESDGLRSGLDYSITFELKSSDGSEVRLFGITMVEGDGSTEVIPPSSELTIRITIPAGTVDADLTDFPVMVRLSDLPADLWDYVKSDGGDIRITNASSQQLPQDLVRFCYTDQDGVIFFKASLLTASDNVFYLTCGNASLEKIPDTNTYGRNAVWSDYESVFIIGETCGDDRTGGAMGSLVNDGYGFENTATSPDVNSHNGICCDGTYYYTSDMTTIYKWDATWTLVDTNSSIASDAGLNPATYDHIGDLDVHDGILWFTMANTSSSAYRYIVAFNASDLSYNKKYDYAAYSDYGAGITYCDKDGLLYLCSYNNLATILKVDPTDGSYQGTLATSMTIPLQQGIVWWKGYFWISSETYSEIVRVSYDGVVHPGNATPGYGGIFGVDGAYQEGVGKRDEDLLVLHDPGATETVYIFKPYDITLGAGGGYKTNKAIQDYIKANGRASYQTFTMGVTANIASKASSPSQCALTYWDESAGTTNTRVSLMFRGSTSIGWGIWDPNNTWLMSSPLIDPTIGTSYRLHAVYSGTTSRKLYVDGAQAATQSSITAAPNALDTVMIGGDDASENEVWDGKLGFAYLRPDALSADWIKAEYDNLNDSDTFYTVEVV